MVNVSNHDFESITDKTIKPKESFVNPYVDECFESNNAKSSTRRMHGILFVKYERADLNDVMTKQCQKHLTNIEYDRLLQIMKKSEDLFDGTLGTWNTTPVELELKDNAKPMCSRPYPAPKLHKMVF